MALALPDAVRLGAGWGQIVNLTWNCCAWKEVDTQEYTLLYKHSFIHVKTGCLSRVLLTALTHFLPRLPIAAARRIRSTSSSLSAPVGSTSTCALNTRNRMHGEVARMREAGPKTIATRFR